MLKNSQAEHSNFTYIPSKASQLLSTKPHYNAISKPLKPNPTRVHLYVSKQNDQACLSWLHYALFARKIPKTAHLNFACTPEYSIPITCYQAPLQRHF